MFSIYLLTFLHLPWPLIFVIKAINWLGPPYLSEISKMAKYICGPANNYDNISRLQFK